MRRARGSAETLSHSAAGHTQTAQYGTGGTRVHQKQGNWCQGAWLVPRGLRLRGAALSSARQAPPSIAQGRYWSGSSLANHCGLCLAMKQITSGGLLSWEVELREPLLKSQSNIQIPLCWPLER